LGGWGKAPAQEFIHASNEEVDKKREWSTRVETEKETKEDKTSELADQPGRNLKKRPFTPYTFAWERGFENKSLELVEGNSTGPVLLRNKWEEDNKASQ